MKLSLLLNLFFFYNFGIVVETSIELQPRCLHVHKFKKYLIHYSFNIVKFNSSFPLTLLSVLLYFEMCEIRKLYADLVA